MHTTFDDLQPDGTDQYITVPTEVFMAAERCPDARDSEMHLRKVRRSFLDEQPAALRKVAVGILNGRVYKLNGHTRTLFWEQRPDLRPASVTVAVDFFDSMEDLLAEHRRYDNILSAEKHSETFTTYCVQLGMNPQSKLLRQGLKSAFDIATRGILGERPPFKMPELKREIREWMPELLLLERLDPPKHWTSHDKGFALLMLRRYGTTKGPYGKTIWQFLTLARSDLGVIEGGQCDAVAKFCEIMRHTKVVGYGKTDDKYFRLVQCVERYFSQNKPVAFSLKDTLAPGKYDDVRARMRQLWAEYSVRDRAWATHNTPVVVRRTAVG